MRHERGCDSQGRPLHIAALWKMDNFTRQGCSNPCSFCHIPRMRGSFRSRAVGSLIAEAHRLEEAGVRELVLIAQDTTRYGEDLGLGRAGLRRLLERLIAETSLPWIRVLYAYPATLDWGVIELMARESRIVPYLDIPFQHASRRVLRAMRRGGSAREFEKLVSRARAAVPGLAVRTTFIVGFPGEGDEEFAELQAFVERMRFDALGVFSYSYQEENPGAALGDPVPRHLKARRRRALMKQHERISREKNRELRRRELIAMVDGPSPESELLLQGRLASQAPEVDGRILISAGTANPGDLVWVTIEKTYAFDLVGRISGSVAPAPARRQALLPSLPVARRATS